MILASVPKAHRQPGFSLLEIMVVMVILGIMISLATISIGPAIDNNVDEHGRRLEALIELALEDAGIQGREYGLTFYQHGYEFAARVREATEDGQQVWVWTPLTADQQLRPRDLTEDISLLLELDGEEAGLLFERDNEATYEPQVYILSSGDVEPPFRLNIRPTFGTTSLTLDVGETGKIEMTYDEF